MKKRWNPPQEPDGELLGQLTDFVVSQGMPPVLAYLLANRGIADIEEARHFLEPSWDGGVHKPWLFRQMKPAVERVFTALENQEKIVVHGDYDADGVTGSAVVITTLREIEKHLGCPVSNVSSYIPHRDKEGYGLHEETVRSLAGQGANLIITVDCGIASFDEIALARSLGIDVIVLDHHQFGEVLPDAILVHPKLEGEEYPFKHLAAVGVAWKFATAVYETALEKGIDMPEGFDKWLLDLVAIATVTDMVPLLGENRVLEKYGLMVMNKTRRPGLRALIRASGQTPGELDAQSIAFGLGPRINAAGRMDHASLALDLMLAETDEAAAELAARLEEQNRGRQNLMKTMLAEAETQLATVEQAPLLSFWSESWQPALVGLVAGKYLDRTGKPTIAIGRHGDRWVGSGRSYAFFDITEAVRRAGEGFVTHVGGHVQACGFSFGAESQVDTLIHKLDLYARENLVVDDLMPFVNVDAEVDLGQVDLKLADALGRLQPFGEGNRKPLFMIRDLEVAACDLVGQTHKHVRCVLRDASGRKTKVIGFNFGTRIDELSFGRKLDIVVEIDVNEWNGRREAQCKLVDVREAGS